MANAIELKLQADCFQWHWNTYPEERQMLYHNNNNSVNAIKGNQMKAVGVVAGVSDFTLVLRNGTVWFLELKTEVGTPNASQITFAIKVRERGHTYIIIRTLEDFKELIRKLYE